METGIQEAFKVLRANVISEVLKLLDKFQDKSELVSNEIRTLFTELDSVWTCHLASKSPLSLSPSRDQVIISQNQEVTQPGPGPINFCIDGEFSKLDASDSAALQREPQNEVSPEVVPLPPPSNGASCRRPQHVPKDNASHDILPYQADVQPSADDLTNIQSLPAMTFQSSSTARDPNTTSNQDANEENPDTDSQVSERHSSHDNNSLEEHIASESVVEHRRDKRSVEETEIGEREEEEEEKEIEEGEDGEEDENDDRDNDEHGEEPQTGLNGAMRKNETIISMQRKENGKRTSKGQKAISSVEPSSARKSKNESKRTASGQELMDSPSKRPKTRVLTSTTDIASLKSLEHIPKSSIQLPEVYKIVLDRSQSKDLDRVCLLTRLFFAIASPDVFYQLRDACISTRENRASTILQPTNSVTQIIQALDNLEIAASTNLILRRYHLTRLVDYRNERESYHKIERPERAVRIVKDSSKGHGRASSLALADLMAQAYPKLKSFPRGRGRSEDEYQRKLKSLKNRISSGRNWYLMQQKFFPGILASVDIGGDNKIYNSEIEKLSTSLFTIFLIILDEFRGDFLHKVSESVSRHIHDILYRKDLSWKYGFEKIDGDTLKKEPLDSPGFIQFCELE